MVATKKGMTALAVASGIGWVEGITHEWSKEETVEAVKLCLELGIDPNAVDSTAAVPFMAPRTKAVTKLCNCSPIMVRNSMFETKEAAIRGRVRCGAWLAAAGLSEGLVGVGVQSAIPHPETAALLRNSWQSAGWKFPRRAGIQHIPFAWSKLQIAQLKNGVVALFT